MNAQRFKDWYTDVLGGLYSNGNAGFVILMVAFPLLERYLREKSGIGEDKLNDAFYVELRNIFPNISSDDMAREFWQVYRNGILHQVTLSLKSTKGLIMPSGWLSNDFATINIDRNGNFCVHPAKFAQHVIKVIEADFETFEGKGSVNHPLPTVFDFKFDLGQVTQGTASPGASFEGWPGNKKKGG